MRPHCSRASLQHSLRMAHEIRQRHVQGVLDVRLVLQTDDAEKTFMTWRGTSYTPPRGGRSWGFLLSRIEPS